MVQGANQNLLGIRGGNTKIVNESINGGENGTPKSCKLEDDHKFVVLIAEDNQMIQQAMQLMLEANNVHYETCLNGNEATEKFEEYLKAGKMFDIILMDLYMPLKDGFQAANEIR